MSYKIMRKSFRQESYTDDVSGKVRKRRVSNGFRVVAECATYQEANEELLSRGVKSHFLQFPNTVKRELNDQIIRAARA